MISVSVRRGPSRGISLPSTSPATRWINLLWALFPGRITAPEYPPTRAVSRWSNRSPPNCRLDPWQRWHFPLRIGSISVSKSTVGGAGDEVVSAVCFCPNVAGTNRNKEVRKSQNLRAGMGDAGGCERKLFSPFRLRPFGGRSRERISVSYDRVRPFRLSRIRGARVYRPNLKGPRATSYSFALISED